MIYIEYMDHDRSIPLELFQAGEDRPRHPQSEYDSIDHPIAALGRALRTGLHPPYLAIWKCRALESLNEWESYFRARQSLHLTASRNAIRLSSAGCYREAFSGPPIGDGIQYIEYFAFGPDHEESEIAHCFHERIERHRNGALNFVFCRMGALGPDPGGLAIWTFENAAEIEKIVLDGKRHKDIDIVTAGIYRKLGEESAG